MSEDELAALEREHIEGHDFWPPPEVPFCVACGEPWGSDGCRVIRLVRAYRALAKGEACGPDLFRALLDTHREGRWLRSAALARHERCCGREALAAQRAYIAEHGLDGWVARVAEWRAKEASDE